MVGNSESFQGCAHEIPLGIHQKNHERHVLNNVVCAGKAAAECVSEEALSHLKEYKYSSIDKSFISRYILKHYVRPTPGLNLAVKI